MELNFILAIVLPFFASAITFFSGFGLSTMLLPAFTILFPIETAVALTAIIHFLNNIFKIFLVGKKAQLTVVLKFGVPAIAAAFMGAWLLSFLSFQKRLFQYSLGNKIYYIEPIKLVIGILMIFFAIIETLPLLKKFKLKKKYLPLGGMLSGFFGGLSGHQGAFRSLFLLKLGLSKDAFIATGVVIACIVDFARLMVYGVMVQFSWKANKYLLILCLATLSAWIGAWVGRKILCITDFKIIRWMVAVMLAIFGTLLAFGII